MRTGRHSRSLTGAGRNEEDIGAELRPSAKAEGIIDETPAALGALQLKAGLGSEILKVAMKEYCFVSDATLSELEHLYELKTDYALSGK